MNKKAIVLLSGGLDSTLAARVLCDQGIEVEALNFTSPFCNCGGRKEGCQHQAVKVARELNIPIRVFMKGMEYMKLVENPPHGSGSGMNPCIDCRIYILRKAKELMAETGASFVATGEVLGQRPMSQQRHTLAVIERESGLAGLILRPLSALHFTPTIPEQKGIVDREKLLAISGRGRREQIELAANLGINDYPCPAGGCLLTDKSIALRLRDLFQHKPDYGMADLHLLTVGRHFRLNPELKIIVGRNETENRKIIALAGSAGITIGPLDFRGPTACADGPLNGSSRETIGQIIAAYSQDDLPAYQLEESSPGDKRALFTVMDRYPREGCDALRIDTRDSLAS